MESATPKELNDVDVMVAMMGGDLAPEVALRLLRKHNGDADKAASALLEGDLGDTLVPPQERPPLRPRAQTPLQPETIPPVIDLTADDEDNELSRALKASLEDQAPKFGPSDRAPDPNWAVVPSNVEAAVGMSQDDQSLSRAIEASLSDGYTAEPFENLPLEEKVRKLGWPVALRPTQASLAYAALILHGLFYVPQVRHAIARWRPSADVPEENVETRGPPMSGQDYMVWSLLEIFANMDLAQLGELNVDAAINAFAAEHWSTPAERPGDVSHLFYTNLTRTIESALYESPPIDQSVPWSRLFHFRYGRSDADLPEVLFDPRIDLSVVKVDIRGTEDTNDLLSCLSAELGLAGPGTDTTKPEVIFEPSAVVAFQLLRDNALPSYSTATGSAAKGRAERTTFRYPRQVYLDQFMRESFEVAGEKRERRRELLREVERLVKSKDALMRFNDRDVLVDLRSSLHYYENVAEDNGDPNRKASIHEAAIQLRKILTRIENELQTIDATITKLKAEAASAFDCPELQHYRYDLRVVLVHDGLYGRNHLYSYVKQKDTWWKTVDYLVTQVSEETILNDPVGLHLGAGPYFLIYSRAVSAEEENMRAPWPEDVKNSIKHNNRMFISSLPPDIAVHVSDPNSPPSSPTPSEYTMSSGTVEPPLSREEPMDLVD